MKLDHAHHATLAPNIDRAAESQHTVQVIAEHVIVAFTAEDRVIAAKLPERLAHEVICSGLSEPTHLIGSDF
jgi:hypothetical protein